MNEINNQVSGTLPAGSPKKGGKKKVIAVIVIVILAIIIAAIAFIFSKLNKINRLDSTVETAESMDETLEEPIDYSDIEPLMDDGLINIMLVGQDRREGQGRQRSDAMILISINPDTMEMSAISFMRDMYVNIPGYYDQRINVAYAVGGAELLSETMMQNFGVTVDGTFEVDFTGFESTIDTLGGVDIELNEDEAAYINKNDGTSFTSGVQHLDGKSALTYARARHTNSADTDYNRTERQRNVLMAIYKEMRTASVSELNSAMDDILPYMSTDLTNIQILQLAAKIFPALRESELSMYRIPADGTASGATINGMMVLVPDLNAIQDLLANEYLPLNSESDTTGTN